MSYTTEAVVLAGYKVSSEAWAHAWGKYEENESYPYELEDMFVDANPMTGCGPLFFGTIIFHIDEDCNPVEFDSILANAATISKISTTFEELFKDYYDTHPEESIPRFKKYIFCRVM